MTSSTRSSESASRSSLKRLSSAIRDASIPSSSERCVRTSSSTSSRLSGLALIGRILTVSALTDEARRNFLTVRLSSVPQGGAGGKRIGGAFDDIFADSTVGQRDRVLDRSGTRASVADDDRPPQTEKVRASHRLRIEPFSNTLQRRPEE